MKRPHLIGVLGAMLYTVITLPAQAAFTGVLPVTPGGKYQAYYDDQLDITWTANANINGSDTWANQVAWAADLNIDGVTGWRLPSMDKNGDGSIESCSWATPAACMDNEYGHLYYYGAGTTQGSGVTPTSLDHPFSNVQSGNYWSGLGSFSVAWIFDFNGGGLFFNSMNDKNFAWAVHEGNVSAVPVPAAVWLFGSGLMGLLGLARRQR